MSGIRPFPVLGASLVIAVLLPTLFRPPGVSVTPDGGSATAPAQSSGLKVTFNVKNFSGQEQDFLLTCSRSGAVSSCSSPWGPLTLGPGEDDDVDVTYSTGNPGSGTVTLTASDIDEDDGYYNVTVEEPPPPVKLAPVLSTWIHNGFYRDVSKCVHGCFDARVTHTTPAYVSMDVEQAVTLIYSSAMAKPVGLVRVKATDNSEVAPDKMSIKLKRGSTWVSFIPNNSTEHFFDADTGNNYLAVEFDATDDSTGAYDYTVYVTSHWPGDTTKTSSAPVRVLIRNEIDSDFGAGWTLAGLQRLYFPPDSGIVITEGDGSIAYFALDGCDVRKCNYDSPYGDFSDLFYWYNPPRYVRTYGNGSQVEFSASGLPSRTIDRFNNTTTYSYSSGRLETITDPVGKEITFSYGGDGKLDWIKDPGGRYTYLTINGAGDLTAIVDPDSVTALAATYNTGHQMQEWQDRRGGVWNRSYDFAGKLAADTLPTITVGGQSVRPVVTLTSPEVYILANPGKGTSSTPAPRRSGGWAYAYVENPREYQTQYALQRHWEPARITEPLGRVTRYWTNSHAQVYREAIPSGDTINYTWDDELLTQVHREFTGKTVNYAYESYAQVDSVWGDTIKVRRFYGTDNVLDSTRVETEPNVSKFEFDSRGRLELAEDPSHRRTHYYYAPGGWQNTDSVAMGDSSWLYHPRPLTWYEYDSYGRMATECVGYGPNNCDRRTDIVYDALNRVTDVVVRIAQGVEDTTRYEYEALFRTKVIDAEGQEYTDSLNALGQVVTRSYPDSVQESFEYDLNGNKTKWVNRRGQVITYTYNELDQLASRTADGQTTTYYTDPYGLVNVASNVESRDSLVFDVAGRPIGQYIELPDTTYVLEASYNKRDTRTELRLTEPWTRTITSWYNELMLLDSLSDITNGVTEIRYNDTWQPDTIVLPTGLQIRTRYTATYQPFETRFSDSDVDESLGRERRLLSTAELDWERTVGDPDTTWEFTHDAAGRLKSYRVGNDTIYSCGEDDLGVWCNRGFAKYYERNYYYDRVGNRTSGGDDSVVVGDANRITYFNGYHMDYDSAGNLTRKYMADTTELSQYLYWNSIGQLDSVRTNGELVSFGYDGRGRRVRRTTSSGTTRYLYDGEDLFVEIGPSGTPVREYTYWPGVDHPHSVRYDGNTYYYVVDMPGVAGLLDASNNIVNRYRYTPFGEPDTIYQSWDSVPQPLRFKAREWDEETGFYYMRARHYDPLVGRFISEDPVGLAGGINLYVFVNNGPTSAADPYGLCRFSDTQCWEIYHLLKAQEGEEFQEAAEAFLNWQGWVFVVPYGSIPRECNAAPACITRGAVWISSTNILRYEAKDFIQHLPDMGNSPIEEGDFLMLAHHESLHINYPKSTAGEKVEDPAALAFINAHTKRAFQQLGPLNWEAQWARSRLAHYGYTVEFYRPLPPLP